MAMDIDDIIAELDRDVGNREEDDLRELTRLWVAERGAPELMPWPESLIKRVTDRIARQVLLLPPNLTMRIILISRRR
jgi:GINS complex subunit 4